MKRIVVLFAGVVLAFSVSGQVRVAGIFGDHMVLQRSQPVPVWGWSSPGEKITVRFNRQSKEAITDAKGKWRVNLEPEPAGGPFELSIQGKNTIVFHNVQVGEVWLCSGQSNMEFELKFAKNADSEIRSASYPDIRQIKIAHVLSTAPKEDIDIASWEVCSDKTAGDFTAVGYFFARRIAQQLHVAVGLINSSWGGTMVETWTSRGAFEKSPEFKTMITAAGMKDIESTIRQRHAELEEQVSRYQKRTGDSIPESQWKDPEYNGQAWPKISVSEIWESQGLGLSDLDGIVWYRKEIILDSGIVQKPVTLSLGKIDDADETYVNGVRVGSTKNYNGERVYAVPAGIFKEGRNVVAVHVEDTGGGGGFYGDSTALYLRTDNEKIPIGSDWHFRIAHVMGTARTLNPNDYPTLLYNAMIHPLIPYAIRGVLWYQGEENAKRAYQYRQSFPLLITDWRQLWAQGNFPFYFVQLSSYNAGNGNSEQGSTWAELREAQTRTLSLPATGMAVTTDIGESRDIHPKNKLDVGLRLAAIALNNLYAHPMEYSGPVYESVSIQGNKAILNFIHTGGGLMSKDKYGYLRGFEIAGSDHHFHYAKAFIENNKVVAYTDEVPQPLSIRYAWADDAGDANLYNQEGFPAVPFRTDQWKGITDSLKYKAGR